MSKFVVSSVMRRNLNWASACANQTSGSPGQNAGSLMATAETFSAGRRFVVLEGLTRCGKVSGGNPERLRQASGWARRWLGSTAGDG